MNVPELRLVEGDTGNEPLDRRDEEVPSYALVMRLRHADPEAIRAVYWEHHQALRALGRHLLGSTADAEDLLHEVFLALPRALGRYRGECSLGTFLSAITVKRAGKMHRGLGRYRRVLGLFGKHARSASDGDHPGLALERSELSASLSRELERLPFAQRAVVVLCLVEERSAAEAAGILGIPEPTVRTRLFYGRQRLRERLGRRDDP
jgi:RNA polymerase sigma-70 factor (ECF subfamily)